MTFLSKNKNTDDTLFIPFCNKIISNSKAEFVILFLKEKTLSCVEQLDMNDRI